MSNYKTVRPTVEFLEKMLLEPIKVLDHGFVRVIDYMGNDESIVQAARVSYGAGTKKTTQDKGLIYYLMRHKHTTPFEMCEIKFHIKVPIFIARQWIRHRTASVNEYSARYSILRNEFYLPKKEHIGSQSQHNKQGREFLVKDDIANQVLEILQNDAQTCYQNYIKMINENESGEVIDKDATGISRELARMNLTLNYYTEFYWKVNLHNLLHFVALRIHSSAQYEIRVYAECILSIIQNWVPLTYGAFCEYRLGAYNISRSGLIVIKKLINGETVNQKDSEMSKREWDELMEILS